MNRRQYSDGSLTKALAILAACLVASICTAPALAGESEVTCGETMKGKGFLTASCTGTITITKGTLDLRGFTVSGAGSFAIECESSCTIQGPGTINSAGSPFGIQAEGRVRIFDVDIMGHSGFGVRTGPLGGLQMVDSSVTGNGDGIQSTRIKIVNSDISGNTGSGVVSTARGVKITDSTIIGNGKDGVSTDISAADANRARLTDCEVSGNGEFGVIAKNVKLLRVIVDGNGFDGVSADLAAPDTNKVQLIDCEITNNTGSGVTGKSVKIKRSIISGNGKDGVSTEIFDDPSYRAHVTDCTITDNGEFGVIARTIKYKGSAVQNNGLAAVCGVTVPCVDLAAVEMPQFAGASICDTSMKIPEIFVPPPPAGDPWGICLDDF